MSPESHPESSSSESRYRQTLLEAAAAHQHAAESMQQTRRPAVWAPMTRAHLDRATAMRHRAEDLPCMKSRHQQGDQKPADAPAGSAERLAPLSCANSSAKSPRRALQDVLEEAAELPAGEEGVSRPRLPLRIGLICDRFLYDTFTGLADLVPLTPTTWREHLHEVDILVVAATWRGHDGSSWDVTGPQARSRRRLLIDTLIPTFRRAGVPTVYYGKEDPPDYREFLDVARACEHIFTTAAEVVVDYRRDCPQALSVDVLPFAVNPLLHTPIGSRRPVRDPADPLRESPVIFAGSWMGRKYPQRATYGSWILDGVIQAGLPLVVVDRHHDRPRPSPNQLLPYRYWPYRTPALDHHQLMGLQRVTDVAVNLNSVLDSQTMFANRALELQASGTMVLSTYNQGLNSYYPQVSIANSARQVASTIQTMDLENLRRIQADGIRQVFLTNHGVDLLARLARTVGMDVHPEPERVLAVAVNPVGEPETRPSEQLRADLAAQSCGPVELLDWNQLDSRLDDIDVLLPVSSRRRYAPDYAADHLAGFRLQSASSCVKLDGGAAWTDALAHRHMTHGDLRQHQEPLLELTGLFRPGQTLGPAALQSPQSTLTALANQRSYVLDHLQHGLCSPRTTASTPPLTAAEHGDDLDAVRQRCREQAEDLDLRLTVIVPVYNNGHHLRHKAFASLRRGAGFARMQVLLIDDGSTDGVTAATVDDLAEENENVIAFHHAPGGSGSASRPRNTGLDLACTEFVTYLDPDDEQHEDGYLHLMERLMEASEADFALGTQITWDEQRRVLDVHAWLSEGIEEIEGLRRPDRDSLRAVSFRPASIEGMVARTDWLKGLGLTQPEGATGQDTLFFQQLLFHTRAYLAVDRPVYVYYGAVDTSIVNVISPAYFRKYLILESARASWLRKVGLEQDYLDTRLEHFLLTWYLPKLARVPSAQRAEAGSVLRAIIACYVDDPADHRWRTPEALRFFGLSTGRQALRGRFPSPSSLRPALGRVRRRARDEFSVQMSSLRRTPWGRMLGGIYRSTVKPRSTAQWETIDDLRADHRELEAPDGPWDQVSAAEARAEHARGLAVAAGDGPSDSTGG